ncbi:MAG: hypothetical protein JWO69_553 [Thermoleophilia bacterium]|nr:hypothetical protein [Thermoleophilia bacterium]
MRIAPSTPVSVSTPQPIAMGAAYRPSRVTEAGLLDLHGVGFFRLVDTLTGYGRATGYDSLAKARRAAYQLSKGAESPAAGVYRSGTRFFVRALAAVAAKGPHDAPGAPNPADTGARLLHFEGNADAHFAWVRDSRLQLIVDGATKIWSRDAHHTPPAA